MRLRLTVTLSFFAISAGASAQEPEHAYRDKYVKNTFGKHAWYRVAAGAVYQEIRNTPHEWGRGMAGFGKRIASGASQHVIKHTIEYGVASIRHEQLGYRPSGKEGFGPRLKYALLSTVITRKTTTNQPAIAASRISGAFGAGFISRLWQPARVRTIGSGFATSGAMLGVDAGTHVIREFWPEIRHPHRH